MGVCLKCSRWFEAKGDWQRYCYTCYQERKRAETDGVERQAFEAGFREGQKRPFDEAVLKLLIALCHPDRHPVERATQANTATRILLDLKQNGVVRERA